ncbi:MAG: AbrB/MazE/SpoVT family DNA-binding domain-containing protein [Armatimonadetes bacterium]|nr:AbrB/MazE/SpoVT family DNA-binding domain-containing protein [Armatimonadota bacterium]
MVLVRVRDRAQVTLPARVRRSLGIEEGDYLQVGVEAGRIVMVPQAFLDKLPEVELSAEGERMLQEGLDDMAAGRVRRHKDLESLLSELHRGVGQD